MSLALGTIANPSHFPLTRVLADSLRRHHPEIQLVCLGADLDDGAIDTGEAPIERLSLADLAIPDRHAFFFRHTAGELAIALKPLLLRALLDRGATAALFLDSDVFVAADLEPLFERVRSHAVTLSPHRLTPSAIAGSNDLRILRAGAFNGGVLGVAAGDEAERFLAWFAERLAAHCAVAPEEGLHGDQRWLDLVPGFIADVGIDRDPGVNVAYWNLDERPVTSRGDGYDLAFDVAGTTGRIFHFSGFEATRSEEATRYLPTLRVSALGPAAPLFFNYGRLLREAGWGRGTSPRQLDFFDNGVAIPVVARRIFAALGPDEAGRFGDPFATAPPASFWRWLNDSDEEGADFPTRLWLAVHDQRVDLQRAFPDPRGPDREAFRRWTRAFGMIEYALDPAFSA